MQLTHDAKWSSPYLKGWDAQGSNFSQLLRGACPEKALPSRECPRCEERERAGVCPAPATIADLLALTPRVHVLCIKEECARHVGGYWPVAVKERMRALDVRHFNVEVARAAGRSLSCAFGLTAPGGCKGPRRVSRDEVANVRKRILPLLGHLHAVTLAAKEGHQMVAVLESDLKPLAANKLTLSEVHSLGRELRRRPFDLVRSASKAQRPTPACAPLAPNIC